MDLNIVQRTMLEPAYQLLPASMNSSRSDIMLLTIGLQESRFLHRKQIGGPARGFWQFEKGGGVRGVMSHHKSEPYVSGVCEALGVTPSLQIIYDTLATNDVLAAAFARLLLYTDPKPLPAIGEVELAWQYYVHNWRPGKPHRHTWNDFYAQAYDFIRDAEVFV